MHRHMRQYISIILLISALLFACSAAQADAVTDWNRIAGDAVVNAGLGPLPADRVLAIASTAVYEATNAITQRYPVSDLELKAVSDASVDAAIAAANRRVLAELVPSQQAVIIAAYQAALAKIPDSSMKAGGITAGEEAARLILAMRANDGSEADEQYRPYTTPGSYVPTVIPEAPYWGGMQPWLMTGADQFRPGPPPALTSERWARDYDEVKNLGGKNSTHRTIEQTDIARFWEEVMPPIYHGIVRSVAESPGREVTQNARLFAAVTQATNDALIAVFDAKYHYNFWRPVTAIRNGDTDGNEATQRDSSWLPYIETPMHPEYPCAHCIVSGTVGAILQAEIGSRPAPILTTTSQAAGGLVRSWRTVDDFTREVIDARIYDGVHYRNSGEIGSAMGKQIANLAIMKYLQPE
ncbi:PAP2 superfamily protein [Nitrosomonas cryotolerans]|uniref:PAP2 superfamily protein n=2 Tax=Nitrosomonas cryotolerans TaxID=44575 RepID=A0A1N6HW74_9PROT|nr:PAP2 superfamily protein [Nitrosomonas cryotolerans]SIO23970.1 PAP2 superfamily protein [Nitrosomonas cryotolerans ATCC 49181]